MSGKKGQKTEDASLSRPNVFKMEISEQYGWSGMHRDLRVFDSPGMSDLWDIASKYKMAVMFDTGLIGTKRSVFGTKYST